MSKFYLTIDDAPSSHTSQKLAFLSERGITAIWFVLGHNIEAYTDEAVQIVREGHIIGNHSYSHPHFPLTSVKKIREEISRTETLIESVYATAGVARPAKIFRFPYGEIGGFFKRRAVFRMLREFGFKTGPFESIQFGSWFKNKPGDRYWMWSYDVREWAIGMQGIRKESLETTTKNLDSYLSSYAHDKDQVLLMHDHAGTHTEFCALTDRMSGAGIVFSPANELIAHA